MTTRNFCVFVALLCCLTTTVILAQSPSNYFSDHDAAVVSRIVLAAQNKDGTFADVETARFAVSTLQLLNKEVPQKDKICAFAKDVLAKKTASSDVRAVSSAIIVREALGCGEKADQGVIDVLETGLESGSLDLIHQALSALVALKGHAHVDYKEDLSPVAQAVHELMETDGTFRAGSSDGEDGSPLNTGLAYHVLALLKQHFALSPKAEEYVTTVAQTVQDLFSATPLDDDGLLEFTDLNALASLKATSLVWTGADALAKVAGGVEISQSQVVGIAEYLVKNKYVANAHDAYYLLSGLTRVATNSFKHSPLVLTLQKSSILTSSKGDEGLVKILVTDIFGRYASKVAVYIVKVFPVENEKQIILRNQQALPVSEDAKNVAYSFNFLATKPDQGFYSMEFNVAPADKNSPYASIEETTRTVKVVSVVEIAEPTLQITDSKEHEDVLASNPIALNFPSKLAEVLRAHAFQTVTLSFRVHAAGRPASVQQAFVRFTNTETQQDSLFVAEQQGKKYKLSLNLKDHIDAFQSRSGKYVITLVVGDSLIQNPISWELATLNIQFGKFEKTEAAHESRGGPQQEIVHQFRAPDKRPPPPVSFVFTGLVLAPLAFFIVGLIYVGANLSNFPFSSPKDLFFAAGFQGCIGALFGLFVIYWLRLTMVQTLGYLLVLGLVTVFFGQYALRYVASLREPHKKAD